MNWIALACTLLLAGGEPAPRPRYTIRTALAKRVEATYSVTIRAAQLQAKEWVVVAARAPEIPGRQVNVSTTMIPAARLVADLSPEKRPLLLARVPATRKQFLSSIPLRVTTRADLMSRQLLRLHPDAEVPKVAPLSGAERKLYLASTALVNFTDKAFRKWLLKHELRRRSREDDVDLGRRAYLAVTRSLKYEFLSQMDRRAAHVCQVGKSDCGGMAVVFVAALRASGVPARLVVGRWAISANKGEKVGDIAYFQQHVKVEFYAAGVGWVPVDLSSAVLHDRSRAGLRFFGRDDGDFLVMHFDLDLEVDSIHFGRQTLQALQGAAYWVIGAGNLENATTAEDWQVRVLK